MEARRLTGSRIGLQPRVTRHRVRGCQHLPVERVIVAAVVVALAAVVAVVAERRRPAPPTQAAWSVPAQLDRDDFDRPHAPWLVAVFTSARCDSCALALDKAAVLASSDVVVQ